MIRPEQSLTVVEGVVHQGLTGRRERRDGHIGGEHARGESGRFHIPSLVRRESASARFVVNLLPLLVGVKLVQLLPGEFKFERCYSHIRTSHPGIGCAKPTNPGRTCPIGLEAHAGLTGASVGKQTPLAADFLPLNYEGTPGARMGSDRGTPR